MKTLITVIYGDNTLKVSFELDSSKCKTNDIMEDVWVGMNRGSCQEFPWFLQLRARSLSVGDFVQIGESTIHGEPIIYQVASIGFKCVTKNDMETFMGQVKTRIDSGDYPFQALCTVSWWNCKKN